MKKDNKQPTQLLYKPLIPNKKTIKAMQDARAGILKTAKNMEDLLKQLNSRK